MLPNDQPALRTHTYWANKERFLFDVDTYASWTAFVVEQGSFTYRIRDSEGEASYGDLVLCPPHTAFHRKVVRALTFHFYLFDWGGGEDEADAGQSGTGVGTSMPYGLIRLKDSARLASNLDYLKRLSADDDKASLMANKQHYLTDLLFMAEAQQRAAAGAAANEDAVMRQARLTMESRLAEPFDFHRLADSIGVSPVQLTRRFKRSYGMTPIAFLTHLRLKKAGGLLLETELTLDRIAKECGYENGFYLSRVFTKRMAMSPSQYRSAYKM